MVTLLRAAGLFLVLTLPLGARPLTTVDVQKMLQPLLGRHPIPALGAALVTSRGLQVMSVVGVRRSTAREPVQPGDAWHLGSDTKAMTATMLACLVEDGTLRWDTTVGEVFGSRLPGLSPRARSVTLLQLLQHRSGLPKDLEWHEIAAQLPLREQRLQAVRRAFEGRRRIRCGSYLYSNLGYVVAAAMAEQRAGQTWESLMQSHVFKPLHMTSVGYGPVTEKHGAWAHDDQGQPTRLDNPAVMGPAGRVHCSLADWSRFVADHLKGARGERALLQPRSYRVLHAPAPGSEEACGWSVLHRAWGGRVLTHPGSNNLNYAVTWLSPERDFAVLVTANCGGEVASATCDEVAGALIEAWLHPPGRRLPARGRTNAR